MDRQRRALERLWTDKCTVIVKQSKTDETTKLTDFTEEILYEDIPCKLSFSTLAAVNGDETAAVVQNIKLFLGNEYNIPAGSKITVTRKDGNVLHYKRSGLPGIFSVHQEITLETFERWA